MQLCKFILLFQTSSLSASYLSEKTVLCPVTNRGLYMTPSCQSFSLFLGELKSGRSLLLLYRLSLHRERCATVVSRHLGNFDARPASFQFQNGGGVIRGSRFRPHPCIPLPYHKNKLLYFSWSAELVQCLENSSSTNVAPVRLQI